MNLQHNRNNTGNASSIPNPFASRAANILIVDDDPGMRRALHQILRSNGFHCLMAADGNAMMDILAQNEPDLILLDVMMPGPNGFDLCRHLRMNDNNITPIIMISARGEQSDLVIGLELGADDYIAKPFGEGELLARVRAMLRRSRMAEPQTAARVTKLIFAGWTVDLAQRNLYSPTGARVDLSGAEYDLLIALLDQPQKVIGRDVLLEMSRARLGNISDRTIDVHICRLRRKLGDDEQKDLIRTVRGFGYIFTQPVEKA